MDENQWRRHPKINGGADDGGLDAKPHPDPPLIDHPADHDMTDDTQSRPKAAHPAPMSDIFEKSDNLEMSDIGTDKKLLGQIDCVACGDTVNVYHRNTRTCLRAACKKADYRARAAGNGAPKPTIRAV